MRKHLEIEVAVTFVVFMLLVMITSISQHGGFITGYAVLSTPEEGQTAIQELFRDDAFSSVGHGARICVNVRNSPDEILSYKVRKRGNVFNIEHDELNCDGIGSEDFIFTFENYDALLQARRKFDINQFKSTNVNDNFKVWESKYIGVGGLVRCDDDFKEKYCPFLDEQLSKREQRNLGITCCTDPDIERPGAFSSFKSSLKQFWWLIALIMISILIGVSALVLLTQKEEELEPDIEQQLKDYIEEARRYNFGDKEIKERLADAGWEQKQITKAFNKLRREHIFNLNERFEKIRHNAFKQ
ncbi:MAG: hypothetical protein ACMXX5_01710 [Candidatus Woesearchaeota archaeon]